MQPTGVDVPPCSQEVPEQMLHDAQEAYPYTDPPTPASTAQDSDSVMNSPANRVSRI